MANLKKYVNSKINQILSEELRVVHRASNETPKIHGHMPKYMLDAAKRLNKIYQIDINYSIPIIAVEPKENAKFSSSDIHGDYFSQGEQAQDLLDEIPEGWSKELYLLFYLNSAGAI